MTGPGIIDVADAGLLTTIQDAGRWGWQHLGVPVGGAMDLRAFAAANRAVGNPAGAAALEVTVVGPTLVLTPPLTIALLGASCHATFNGAPVALERPFDVARAGTLRIGRLHNGARAYLAVRGGIDVPPVLGSRSTTIGVCGGRPIRPGDRFRPQRAAGTTPTTTHHTSATSLDSALDVSAAAPQVLRVLPGPDVPDRDRTPLDVLCASTYDVTSRSNRMACRLTGPPIAWPVSDRLSTGTVVGAIQIPPDGQPILLMADRQTTGGYPVVAVVISADVPRAGQLAPGDRCRFAACTRADALTALLRDEQRALRAATS